MAAIAAGLALLAFGRFDNSPLASRLLWLVGGPGSPVLTGSVGALFVGAVLVASTGAWVSSYTKHRRDMQFVTATAELRRIDAAVAMTLAAVKVDAERASAQALVEDKTGVAWTVENLKPSTGAVMARAQLHDGEAIVTYGLETSGVGGTLETRLNVHGRPTSVGRYVFGTVVPASDLRSGFGTVTVSLHGGRAPEVYKLPAGTLPPALGSAIVAREGPNGKLVTLQTVDGVLETLSAQKQRSTAPALNNALPRAVPPKK